MRPPHVFAQPAIEDQADILALLHGPLRFALRLLIVLMSIRGYTATTIAELFEIDPTTVRRWIWRFNREGIDGLDDRPRPGRPALGSRQLGDRIRRLLAEPRAWTVRRLWRRLRPGVSVRTLHRRVRQVAHWRRPRLVAKGDPNEQAVLQEVQREISNLPQGGVLLAEDETHINLLPWLRSTWVLIGSRLRVMTPGTNRRRTIFGAVNLATGRWFQVIAARATSRFFIQLLEQVLAAYPTAPAIAMVLDNVSIHSCRAVQTWLAAHPHVRLIYGARYCPHHNPVERIWAALKAYLANSPVETMAGRLRQVHAFFRDRSDDQLLSTASPFKSPWLPVGYGQNLREAA